MSHKILKIKKVVYLQDYVLRIDFIDGHVREIDFYQFLNSSTNSEIKKFLDKNKFKNFTINDGELMWGDFELIFPIYDLYNGKISA